MGEVCGLDARTGAQSKGEGCGCRRESSRRRKSQSGEAVMSDLSTSLDYVFDAYGTLFDVHAGPSATSWRSGPHGGSSRRSGAQSTSSTHARVHMLEYTWVHALSRRPATFWDLAQQSLDHA